MAYAEDLGTGINKVYEYLKPYANTIPIFTETDTFAAEIPLVTMKVDVTIDERWEKTLVHISAMTRMTVDDLARNIQVNRRTILRDLEQMQIHGILKRLEVVNRVIRRC